MKHAYLIMAYNNWSQLMTLVRCLDDSRNYIYIHIDSKSADFNQDEFQRLCGIQSATMIFIDRQPLYWGTVSEVDAELRLMEAAINGYQFDYCHLLSGQDFPIKSLDEIDGFLEKNRGKNFIEFNDSWFDLSLKNEQMQTGSYKINYYHPLVRCINYRNNKIIKYTDHFIAHVQKWLKLRRHKYEIYAGSQFFSITYNLAKYLVERKSDIEKDCYCTLASSEVFLQTNVMMSPYRDTIYSMKKREGNVRYIDWSHREGSGPKTFTMEDYETLIHLPENFLFARKFNEKRDNEVIQKICKRVNGTI